MQPMSQRLYPHETGVSSSSTACLRLVRIRDDGYSTARIGEGEGEGSGERECGRKGGDSVARTKQPAHFF